LNLDEKQLKYLKRVWDELVVKKEEYSWPLKPVPYQDERKDYLYIDASEGRRKGGYIGFKKIRTNDHIFGLYFEWKKRKADRDVLGKVCIYVHCKDRPTELQGESKKLYDRMEKDGRVSYEKEYREYQFDVTDDVTNVNMGRVKGLLADLYKGASSGKQSNRRNRDCDCQNGLGSSTLILSAELLLDVKTDFAILCFCRYTDILFKASNLGFLRSEAIPATKGMGEWRDNERAHRVNS
jgi:hypothetical protein